MQKATEHKVAAAIARRTAARLDAGDAAGLVELHRVLAAGTKAVEAAILELDRRTPASDEGTPDEKPAAVEASPAPVAGPAPADREPTRGELAAYRALVADETRELFAEIQACGGIRPSSDDLREEYRAVPNVYRSPDGMRGDELADELATRRPELGIRDEAGLLAFFDARTTAARNARARA